MVKIPLSTARGNTHELVKRRQSLANHVFNGPRRGLRSLVSRGEEAIENGGERTPFGSSTSRHVADELRIEGPTLAVAPMQTTVGREIGRQRHEVLLECHGSHQRQEERLSRTVITDDKTTPGAAVCDVREVMKPSRDLPRSTDLNVSKPKLRDDTCGQCL